VKRPQIYFAGSIRGGRDDARLYQSIIKELTTYGDVLTEHVGSDLLTSMGEGSLSDIEIHDRDLSWIKASDIIIAEVSTPSLGVGYEIGMAINLQKPVVCLFNASIGNKLSAMINGADTVKVFEYKSRSGLSRVFKEFVFSDSGSILDNN